MAKYYVVKQVNVGNGSSTTTIALVTDPKIEGTSIQGTKVGEIDWNRSSLVENVYKFEEVPPREFIIVGNATCEECCVDPFTE